MNVSFNGFGENVATFEMAANVEKGVPVMITDNGKVSLSTGPFCGVCVGTRNGFAAVQLTGYVRLPYTTAPSIGYSKISVSGGKITADNSTGREYLIVDLDTTNKIAGIML